MPAWLLRVGPALVVGLAILLLLEAVSSQLLNDPDTQWHVATGRWIWAQMDVPRSDVFSHTFAGSPWIAKEWLSQMIVFAAYQAAGWRGVTLAAAIAIAAAYGLLFDWLRQRVRFSVALPATLVAVMLAAPHLLARPHALVFPVIVVWLTQLAGTLETRSAPPPRLALVMVLWANMHGSFLLGLVLAGILAGEGVLLRPGASRLAALRGWALFLGAAGAATLVTPYGWQAILVPLTIGGSVVLPFISEWQPLALDASGLLALGVLAATLVVLAGDARANAFRIVATLLLAGLMIRHSRFTDMFGIAAPILAADALATRWGLTPDRDSRPGLAPFWAAALLVLAILGVGRVVAPKLNPQMTPDAAFRAAMARGASGPVYNEYDFGGFLIAHDVKTFVDGRSDQLFLGDFLPGLGRALAATDDRDFVALLERYRVGWALVRTGSKDARHLGAMPGWSKLFEDDVAAAFMRAPSRTSAAR